MTAVVMAAATLAPESAAQAGTWSVKASLSGPIAGHAAAVAGGKLYVTGGFTGTSTCTEVATVSAYDVTSNSWTPRAPLPASRAQHAAATINGIVYVVGGLTSCGSVALTSLTAYDPATNTWTARAPMPTARGSLAVGVVDGILYAVGGLFYVGVNGFVTNAVEAYNPATNTWSTKASLPTARYALRAGVVNGVLYAIGGSFINGTLVATVEAYDPGTNTWSTKASMPLPKAYGMAVETIDNIMFVAGGTSTGSPDGTVLEYNAATNSWATNTAMITPRVNLAGGLLNGALHTVGGQNGAGVPQPTHEAFTPGSPWTNLGFALAGVNGNPMLAGTGPLKTGSSGTLTLSNAAGPGALAVMFASLSSAPAPFKGGTLVPVPIASQITLLTAGSPGSIPLSWSSWPAGLSGQSLYLQYAIADAGAVNGVALSNALRANVP